jgi:FKBP-type peptidyl-prolyl cis-trans isomerase 2
MAFKKHDFIELDYTGKLEDGTVFDTTKESVAKEHHLHNEKAEYKSIIVCIGEHQVVPGLDNALVGKEIGKNYTITVSADDGFGKKDAKKIRLVPMSVFKKQNVMPHPGLQVNIDNHVATILRVSGGRVLVDFNHPLAGKNVIYDITIKREIKDKKEQITEFLKLALPLKSEVTIKNDKAIVLTEHNIPPEITTAIKDKLKDITGLPVTIEQKKEKIKTQESPEKEPTTEKQKDSEPQTTKHSAQE